MVRKMTKEEFRNELKTDDDNRVYDEIKKKMDDEGKFFTLDVEIDPERELEMEFENNFR